MLQNLSNDCCTSRGRLQLGVLPRPCTVHLWLPSCLRGRE